MSEKTFPEWQVHTSGWSFVVEADTWEEAEEIVMIQLGGLDKLPIGTTIKKLREEKRG